MNASRIYTAQEMREAATTLYKRGDELTTDEMLAFSAMLRQAAGMRERCEEAKSKYCLARNRIDKVTSLHPDATYEMILSKIKEFDYILKGKISGGAGKEEK